MEENQALNLSREVLFEALNDPDSSVSEKIRAATALANMEHREAQQAGSREIGRMTRGQIRAELQRVRTLIDSIAL